MQDTIDQEKDQHKNLTTQPVKTIDSASAKTIQKQLQNKSKPQTKINIQQKVSEAKKQQQSSHKVGEKKEQKHKVSQKPKEQIIKQYIKSHKIQITNAQINDYVKQESTKSPPFEPLHLLSWIQSHKNDKEPQEMGKQQKFKSKTEIVHQKQSKNEQKIKKEEKILLTNKQIIENFLQKQVIEEIKQIQPDIIQVFNKQINSSLEISSQTIQTFLKSGDSKNLESFKKWLTTNEQVLIQQWNKNFSKSAIAKQTETNLAKLKSIVDLADQNKSNLNINLSAGDNKGKTALKIGMLLKQSHQSKFLLSFQVKIKKKVQLRHFIQNQIKKSNKSQNLGVFKLCKIKFEQTQKSLKIQLSSKVFETYVFKNFIEFLEEKVETEKNLVLKAQIQVNIKNSIRQDQNLLQNKRFVKWLAEGFTKSIKIQGNNKVSQHFSSPLAQYFPILKVVRSGDIVLKLKQVQNVDKLFEKLGISQISQQTPTLQKYLQIMLKQYLDSNKVIWVGEIIKYVLLFACNIPNQRISIDVNIIISHLLLYLNISAQACKELGELVSKTNVEQFS